MSDLKVPFSKGMTYFDAGVDIDAGNHITEKIRALANRTMRSGVLGSIGGFNGLFEIPKHYTAPVLVSGTDGVGTKLKLAFELNRHHSIGQDLVAMSVNDILVQGAEPLFFLDYFACGHLDIEIASAVIGSIAKACKMAGCALIGGETAEMPGMYVEGEYDLAGFAVGIIEKDKIIDGRNIIENDIVLGLSSSGVHSNGYSLIRRIIQQKQLDLQEDWDGVTLADVLMKPTRIYVKSLLNLISKIPVKGIAHITGGGLLENIPRILPEQLKAELNKHNWLIPRLFNFLREEGNIDEQEMYRVFNCGIGMVIIISPKDVEFAVELLSSLGEVVWNLGIIRRRNQGEKRIIIHS